MKNLGSTLIILGTLALAAPSFGQRQYEAPYIGYPTPHVGWATPWAEGKMRVLHLWASALLSNEEYGIPGCNEREAIELVQRMDIRCDSQMFVSYWLGLPMGGPKVLEQFNKTLGRNRYDVFVLTNVVWGPLKPETKYHILRQVADGSGLVCIGFNPEKEIPGAKVIATPSELVTATGLGLSDVMKPVEKLAGESKRVASMLTAYTIGKGRGISVNFPGDYYVKKDVCDYTYGLAPRLKYTFENAAEYEYWLAWLGKLILWSGQKSGPIVVRAKAPEVFQLENRTGQPRTVKAEVTIKDSCGDVVRTQSKDLSIAAKATAELAAETASLGNGKYYAELILSGPKGKEGYGCLAFRKQDRPRILTVATDRPFQEVGEKIAVTVKAESCPNGIIRAELVTIDKRVIARQEQKLESNRPEHTFSFILGKSLLTTIEMRARASLWSDGNLLDVRDAAFQVPHRNREGFTWCLWAQRSVGILAHYAFKRLHDEAGFSSGTLWGGEDGSLTANNMSPMAHMNHITNTLDANGMMTPVCWNNTAVMDKSFQDAFDGIGRGHWQGAGVLAYSLGDEIATEGCCRCEFCKKAYSAYLQGRYGTIENLNAVWGSSYKDFAAVDILDPTGKDLDESGAKKQGNYPRWYERRVFMRNSFTDLCRRYDRLAKKFDPHAIIGFDGAGKMESGPDYDAMVTAMGYWVPYGNVGWEVIRGLADKKYICSTWEGYTKSPEALVRNAWQKIIHGANSYWWWMWDGEGTWDGFIQSNMEFFPSRKAVVDEMKIVREGLGDLVVAMDRSDDGVAILYSGLAVAGATCNKHEAFGSYETAHTVWTDLLYNLGVGFRYTTPKRIGDGDLKGKKVLILPMAVGLDAATADAIRDFVAGGGTVIADVRPGVFDGYCRPVTGGVLDTLFGVKQAKAADPKTIELTVPKHRDLKLPQAATDAGLVLAGAKAEVMQNNIPLLCSQYVGKGRAILFNFTLSGFGQLRVTKDSAPVCKFIESLLAEAGVEPAVRIRSMLTGTERGSLEIAGWNEGPVRIVAIFNTSSTDKAVTVGLREEKAVYAINPKNKFFGRVRSWNTKIPARRAVAFAILPQELTQPIISRPESLFPGQPAQITVKTPGLPVDGMAAFHVRLEQPDGTIADWSPKVILTEKGIATYTWTPAFNDPTGTWKIHVRPLFVGGEIIKSVDLSFRKDQP